MHTSTPSHPPWSARPSVSVDGEELTQDEIRALIEAGRGLAFIEGKWVEADAARLKKALEMFEGSEENTVTVAEAMRMAAGIDESPFPDAEMRNGKWLKDMVRRMREADFPEEEAPESFKGSLRPYQSRGYSWLWQLRRLGFGACLADDMGLGKTVQVIAYLERLRAESGGRHLLVVPASLMGNWQRGIAKFAPGMPFSVYHGKSELQESEGPRIHAHIGGREEQMQRRRVHAPEGGPQEGRGEVHEEHRGGPVHGEVRHDRARAVMLQGHVRLAAEVRLVRGYHGRIRLLR